MPCPNGLMRGARADTSTNSVEVSSTPRGFIGDGRVDEGECDKAKVDVEVLLDKGVCGVDGGLEPVSMDKVVGRLMGLGLV